MEGTRIIQRPSQQRRDRMPNTRMCRNETPADIRSPRWHNRNHLQYLLLDTPGSSRIAAKPQVNRRSHFKEVCPTTSEKATIFIRRVQDRTNQSACFKLYILVQLHLY